MARKYYDKLFKEYCLTEMSGYKKGRIGLRWRTEKEVMPRIYPCPSIHWEEGRSLDDARVCWHVGLVLLPWTCFGVRAPVLCAGDLTVRVDATATGV